MWRIKELCYSVETEQNYCNGFIFFLWVGMYSGIESNWLLRFSCVFSNIFSMQNKAVEVVYELKGTSIFLVGKHYWYCHFLFWSLGKICTIFTVANPLLTGMNSTMKTNLGKLLSEVLRYYYFDRWIGISKFHMYTYNEIIFLNLAPLV